MLLPSLLYIQNSSVPLTEYFHRWGVLLFQVIIRCNRKIAVLNFRCRHYTCSNELYFWVKLACRTLQADCSADLCDVRAILYLSGSPDADLRAHSCILEKGWTSTHSYLSAALVTFPFCAPDSTAPVSLFSELSWGLFFSFWESLPYLCPL